MRRWRRWRCGAGAGGGRGAGWCAVGLCRLGRGRRRRRWRAREQRAHERDGHAENGGHLEYSLFGHCLFLAPLHDRPGTSRGRGWPLDGARSARTAGQPDSVTYRRAPGPVPT